MSTVDDVKSRLDIVSYIGQYVPLKKAGRTYKACCPFHAEKTPSFVVNEDNQTWRCYGACAEGGDVLSFAMKYHGWDFKEALGTLAQAVGVTLEPQTDAQKQRTDTQERLRGMLKSAADAYHAKLFDDKDEGARAALAYATTQRGLSTETLSAFSIGYAPPGWDNMLNYLLTLGYSADDVIAGGLALLNERTGKAYDRFRNRLVVPIRDARGRVVGFGGRILDPQDNPKYLNSPQSEIFDKSQILFGLDLAKNHIRESETAVIVEGYMDAITAHQAGYGNVVAQMGTALTETQLKLIAPKWAKRIVLALDSDAAGQNATKRSLEVAREALAQDFGGRLSVDMRVLQIPDAKDPDDFIREQPQAWEQQVAAALPIADYLINLEVGTLAPNASMVEREALARRIVPVLLATENSLYQMENVQKLAMRLLLPERELLRIAEELRRKEAARPKRIKPLEFDDEPPPIEHERRAAPSPRDDEQPPARTSYDEQPISDDAEPPPQRSAQMADAPTAPQRPARAVVQPTRPQTRLEAHFLHRLILHPETYYKINGVFSQLNNEKHPPIPLQPLGYTDFTDTGLQQLMQLFLRGLDQDEHALADYLHAYADESLREALELVMVDSLMHKVADPRAVSPKDWALVQQSTARVGTVIDPHRDLLIQALRLRHGRIVRERESLRLIQQNALQQQDLEQAGMCAQQIDQLARLAHIVQDYIHKARQIS